MIYMMFMMQHCYYKDLCLQLQHCYCNTVFATATLLLQYFMFATATLVRYRLKYIAILIYVAVVLKNVAVESNRNISSGVAVDEQIVAIGSLQYPFFGHLQRFLAILQHFWSLAIAHLWCSVLFQNLFFYFKKLLTSWNHILRNL